MYLPFLFFFFPKFKIDITPCLPMYLQKYTIYIKGHIPVHVYINAYTYIQWHTFKHSIKKICACYPWFNYTYTYMTHKKIHFVKKKKRKKMGVLSYVSVYYIN